MFGQDFKRPLSQGGLRLPQRAALSGEERIDPPRPDDTLFVLDSGTGLDTGCTYDYGGPLTIDLPVTRVVGEVDANGTLLNIGPMVDAGLVSPFAHLLLPAFDVDVHGAPGYPPEHDEVYFNGADIGRLNGDNNVWSLNDFSIPISLVKFPALPPAGGTPVPADNIITIQIDVDSHGAGNWCTAVDWVALQFGAIAPIFLVHGTNADPSTWAPAFANALIALGVPWSNDITLPPEGPILGNGHLLAAELTRAATRFGATKCHIIAHSKGGLDTRAFLNHDYDPSTLKVLSVHTLSTPHHGTILSDIYSASRSLANTGAADADLQYLIDHDPSWLAYSWLPLCVQVPHGAALADQTTENMAAFNEDEGEIPQGVQFYSYGADADLDHNHTISLDETSLFFQKCSFDPVSDSAKLIAANTLYRTLGQAAEISATRYSTPTGPWGTLVSFQDIDLIGLNTTFAPNDFVVTSQSATWPDAAHYLGTLPANHATIKSRATAEAIVRHIQSLFPVQ